MQQLTSCQAFTLDSSGQILIIRRSETDVRRPLQWDLPGGHAEPGELPENALERELLEETGLVPSQAPKFVFESSHDYDDLHVRWRFYVVHVKGREIILSPEHDQFRWVSVEEAIRAIEYDRKRDALVYAQEHDLL